MGGCAAAPAAVGIDRPASRPPRPPAPPPPSSGLSPPRLGHVLPPQPGHAHGLLGDGPRPGAGTHPPWGRDRVRTSGRLVSHWDAEGQTSRRGPHVTGKNELPVSRSQHTHTHTHTHICVTARAAIHVCTSVYRLAWAHECTLVGARLRARVCVCVPALGLGAPNPAWGSQGI